MYSLSKIIKTIDLIALMLGCFGLSPLARAVCQEGCLTNENTALGEDALLANTGFFNTAIGFDALTSNATGYDNTALGDSALLNNKNGIGNATGTSALLNNSNGNSNTATGTSALLNNSNGGDNTATGYGALYKNANGFNNTATGYLALYENKTGNYNTTVGVDALFYNTTGNNNIALGFLAGQNLTTGDNNIDIGNEGVDGESGIIRIGTAGTQTATFISGVRETPLAQGVAVAVGITADGQLGVRASSARFKEAIQPMDKASEAIFSLQPVTFRYKKAFDPQALPQFGLVAEQVAKVNPDLVVRDAEGKPFAVCYDEVNAMLLNEFLKEHRKVGEHAATITDLQSTVAQQQKDIAALTAALKAQAEQIQKVSDQLRTQAPAPRVVAND